jgi:hypothetical protein
MLVEQPLGHPGLCRDQRDQWIAAHRYGTSRPRGVAAGTAQFATACAGSIASAGGWRADRGTTVTDRAATSPIRRRRQGRDGELVGHRPITT